MDYRENILNARDITVRDIFKKHSELGLKIVFLADDNKLLGSISNGDVLRFILNGGNLNAPAESIAIKNPITASSYEKAASILSKSPNLKAVPVVDENRNIIDICSIGKLQFDPIHIPVVINAGGKGTRLDPYTRILPKPLIPIGNMPIIELIMQEYQKYACNAFSIILNYKGQMIKAYFSENGDAYDISWVDENEPLGTGGGLGFMKDKLDDTFFFANCDTLIQTDYASIYDYHKKEQNVITIVCAYKNVKIPYGVIETDTGGTIMDMKEKPEISFLVNTGMYLVEPEVLDEIAINECVDFPTIIERVRKRGKRVGVYPINEMEWLDMGQLEELNRARDIILKENRVK